LAYPSDSNLHQSPDPLSRYCINPSDLGKPAEKLFLKLTPLHPGPVSLTINNYQEKDLISAEILKLKSQFQEIFQDDLGYELSLKERKSEEVMNKPEFTYGEVEFLPIIPVFQSLPVQANARVWDLGCGTGKLLATLSLVFPSFELSGVEYLESLYQQCRSNLSKLSQGSLISLIHGDLLSTDWSSGDVVYCANLCFPESLNNHLSLQSTSLKPGSFLILLKPVDLKGFTKWRESSIEMSWGSTSLYIYQRLNS
jgi:SAM-dependent methyltransferase